MGFFTCFFLDLHYKFQGRYFIATRGKKSAFLDASWKVHCPNFQKSANHVHAETDKNYRKKLNIWAYYIVIL